MHSPFTREASEICFHGCCSPRLPCLHDHHSSSKSSIYLTTTELKFAEATAASLSPNSPFTNHESLPSLQESFSFFIKAYPSYSETDQADRIRAREYDHLALSNHACLDYIGQGLFSHAQQKSHRVAAIASSSTSSSLVCSSGSPFFSISHKPVKLNFQELFGGQQSELESQIRKRIMTFMNASEAEYNVVFTANQSSAFKVLADCYPFQSNKNLVTAYDYENEAVELMMETAKKYGARVTSAEFSWPSLSVLSEKLEKLLGSARKKKKKKKGLFVFPLQSRVTGARYSYLWMRIAQENGWHVLLDASALGPKDMETLGLSLFKPDFFLCSFYKIFGEDPSGFGCLFVKKTSVSILLDLTAASNICIVRLMPASISSPAREDSEVADLKPKTRSQKDDLGASSSSSGPLFAQQINDETSYSPEIEEISGKRAEQVCPENTELETPLQSARFTKREGGEIESSEIECRGLDHADSLGLILISNRTRYLINWLINALTNLHHPNQERDSLVKIYGPKVKIYRGPAVAFNIFDWNGEKIDTMIVQKLADRNRISLSCGYLNNIWFFDKSDGKKELLTEKSRDAAEGTESKNSSKISVVSAAIGLMTNFEDVYRVWGFVSRFLDADFVEKEKWRYQALNQSTIEF